MASIHTHGPTCKLARTVAFSGSKENTDIPELKAQFFYASPLPIDDPLSAVPVPSGSDSKGTKHPLRPFSLADNHALEIAWASLASDADRKLHLKSLGVKDPKIISSKNGKKDGKKDDKADGSRRHSFRQMTKDATGVFSFRQLAKDASGVSLLSSSLPSLSSSKESKGFSDEHMQERRATIVNELAVKHSMKHRERFAKKQVQHSAAKDDGQASSSGPAESGSAASADESPSVPLSSRQVPMCCADLEHEVTTEFSTWFSGLFRSKETKNELDKLLHEVVEATEDQINKFTGQTPKALKSQKDSKSGKNRRSQNSSTGDQVDGSAGGKSHSRDPSDRSERSYFDLPTVAQQLTPERKKGDKKSPALQRNASAQQLTPEGKQGDKSAPVLQRNLSAQQLAVPGAESGTSGLPFARPASRGNSPTPSLYAASSRGASTASFHDASVHDREGSEGAVADEHECTPNPFVEAEEIMEVQGCKASKNVKNPPQVHVGVSRLHHVTLPQLQMRPTYWSPVHDIAAVTRGTWFYKENMYPVEPAVANRLEAGFRELRPWSETWSDEINSALEVGAAGEEKITYPLWPTEISSSPSQADAERSVSAHDPYCAAKCFQGEAAAAGTVDDDPLDRASGKAAEKQNPTIMKRYPNSHVIYKDAQNAFILKPNLQPSSYYGRKPLTKIMKKGGTVGIHVVRGFDWTTWEKLHPSKKAPAITRAKMAATVAGPSDDTAKPVCPACKEQEEKPKCTDLVLVIHGIGQKLSERIESYHFTHAINGFRRTVNMELGNPAVTKVLRDNLGGIMVLPVNWRSTLSFEEGGPMKPGDKAQSGDSDRFELKDITADTIPAVRNLISDVMLDVPFYMTSHHKPRMLQALITEANRIYRLWCSNNPEFHQNGRVHIVAHSLGSAMALDALSKQPTTVPAKLSVKPQNKFFDFDTKNVFFVGSPAGLFLLFDRGKLEPRQGRLKPGVHPEDLKDKALFGEQGKLGCLAVDNLYNVMHYNDPIAYRLNAAVDLAFSKTLKNAQVPSSAQGWLASIGQAMQSITPGATPSSEPGVGELIRPLVARMPSQVEMEVHDFAHEEAAEKKFHMLNDNGQVDYFLSSGGGPLEIQYLNMLSAHSSYWGSQDFARMLVTEVGRKPGRQHTLPNMKATKVARK